MHVCLYVRVWSMVNTKDLFWQTVKQSRYDRVTNSKVLQLSCKRFLRDPDAEVDKRRTGWWKSLAWPTLMCSFHYVYVYEIDNIFPSWTL